MDTEMSYLYGHRMSMEKTSFFEAVTLGLFGRDGLVLVPRARAAAHGDAVDRFKASYSQFLSNTLHHRATETGPAKLFGVDRGRG